MLDKLKDPAVRQYIYVVCSAAVPLLVGAGMIAPDQADQVLYLVAAMLGTGPLVLAAANTNNKKVSK